MVSCAGVLLIAILALEEDAKLSRKNNVIQKSVSTVRICFAYCCVIQNKVMNIENICLFIIFVTCSIVISEIMTGGKNCSVFQLTKNLCTENININNK